MQPIRKLLVERKKRTMGKQLIDNLTEIVEKVHSMSNNNYMARVKSVPVPSKPQDATTCSSAIKEINRRLKQIETVDSQLAKSKSDLFQTSGTKLKPWAKKKFQYCENTASKPSSLKEVLSLVKNDIEETHEKLSEIHKFKLSSAESQRKRKRALDNAQKAKKRKIEAQQTRTLDLLKDLCKKN